MEDCGSIRNDLERRPSERNEGNMVEVVDESSKLPFFDGNEQFVDDNEKVGGDGVAIEDAREGPTNDNIIIEGFGEEQRPLEEW